MARSSKKKRPAPRRANRRPKNDNLWVPIAVPSAKGTTDLVIGEGTLKNGLIVLKLNDSLGSVAVQRMWERGAILGMQFVMLQEDDVNVAQQERIAQENKDREDLRLLNEDKIANPEKYADDNEAVAEAQEIIDGVSLEDIEEEPTTDLDPDARPEGYDTPVYLGLPDERDSPQVGWAQIKEDGSADVFWDGEPPFDAGTLIKSNISTDAVNVYSVESGEADIVVEAVEVEEEQNDEENKENN